MARVYCHLTAEELDALASGGITVQRAFAVTPDVRGLVPDGDEELFEHLATQFAAASAPTGSRVVVAALDIAPARIEGLNSDMAGSVRVDGPVVVRDVVCYLVGDEGDEVTADADLELSWYDAAERGAVRALV